jgi:hypothetical protein
VNVPPHLLHLSSARPEMPHVSAVSVNQALYRPARVAAPHHAAGVCRTALAAGYAADDTSGRQESAVGQSAERRSRLSADVAVPAKRVRRLRSS